MLQAKAIFAFITAPERVLRQLVNTLLCELQFGMPCTASVEVTLVHRVIQFDHKDDTNARVMPKENCAEEKRRIRNEAKSEGRASLCLLH